MCFTDTFILKTKKLYSDSRTQRNLDKLNSELRDVHSIMTKNISELLERGDRLERTLADGQRGTAGVHMQRVVPSASTVGCGWRAASVRRPCATDAGLTVPACLLCLISVCTASLVGDARSPPPLSFALGTPPRHTDVANKSMRLAQESKKYAAQARHANRMRLVRQYVPLGVVGLVVLAALVWVVRSRG